jgi:hypothetical protein
VLSAAEQVVQKHQQQQQRTDENTGVAGAALAFAELILDTIHCVTGAHV